MTINLLEKKISAASLNIEKKSGCTSFSNTSENEISLLLKTYPGKDSKYCKVCFSCDDIHHGYAYISIEGLSKAIGIATCNSEYIYENIADEKIHISIIISGKTTVHVQCLSIEFFDKKNIFNSFLMDIPNSENAVITPHYPSVENRYLCGFVHSRIKAYHEAGLNFNVFACYAYSGACKYMYEGMQVFRISYDILEYILRAKKFRNIMMHFFDEQYNNIFELYGTSNTTFFLYSHGVETLYWDWNKFTNKYFSTSQDALNGEQQCDFSKRDEIIKKISGNVNTHWIFVSEWAKKQSEKLIGIAFKNYSTIPNFIDTKLFANNRKNIYPGKKRIFLLRRYDNIDKYGVDIAVRAILELSRRECFDNIEFNIYGMGDYFDELFAPLKSFNNVHFHRYFLSQHQISEAHTQNDIALFPTRYDSQGVSMCEAASSGLAVVSSDNPVTRYFLPNNLGLLVETENYIAYADVIERLVQDEDYLQQCSAACHQHVASICSLESTIYKELELFKSIQPHINKSPKITVSAERKTLSIAVPAYNIADLITRCLNSLVHNELANKIEVLVINDGSTDNTKDIVEEFIEKNNLSNFKLINKANGGHGSTINIGIKEATGLYFRVVDGDDWVDTDNLIKLVDSLETCDEDIVVTDYSEFHLATYSKIRRNYFIRMVENIPYTVDDMCLDDYGFLSFGPVMATSCYKLQMLRSVDTSLREKCFYVDMQLNTQVILAAKTIKYFNLDIYRYYIGRTNQSISKNGFIKNRYDHEAVILTLISLINDKKYSCTNKRDFIIKRYIVPMINVQYLILFEFMKSSHEFMAFDKKLRIHHEFYAHNSVSTMKIRFLRTTRALILYFPSLMGIVKNAYKLLKFMLPANISSKTGLKKFLKKYFPGKMYEKLKSAYKAMSQ